MKRILRPLLLLMALAALMSISVFATGEKGTGFYDIGVEDGVSAMPEGVTITPKTADSQAAQKISVCWGTDGKVKPSALYSDSVKLDMTISNAVAGKSYLVLISDGDSLPKEGDEIYYINQLTAQANGDLSFDSESKNALYPKPIVTEAEECKQVYIHITSDDKENFSTITIPVYYAYEVGYVEPDYPLGDVDLNYTVDVYDAVPVLRFAAELDVLTDLQMSVADTDGSGEVDVYDAVPILRFAAELIDSI